MALFGKLFGGGKAAGDAPAPRRPASANIRITNPWHAVSVQSGSQGCEAARSLHTVRFLSAQAPNLPLAKCSKPGQCRCVYRHHDDRRAGPRRSLERGSPLRTGSLYPGEERRQSTGRRSTD